MAEIATKTSMQNNTEKIICAAIKLADGSIFKGFAHGYAIERAWAAHKTTPEAVYNKLFGRTRDGFMTSKGRFVSRKAAYEIATKYVQITSAGISQAVKDLWGNHVEASNELCALSFNCARTDSQQLENMETNKNAAEEKVTMWRLIDKILGQTKLVMNHRQDWRIHDESDTSIVITFSKLEQLFYDVSKKDLEQGATHRRAFFVFLAGSHKNVYILPAKKLLHQIESHGLIPSQEYGDYKLHLIQDYSESNFREMPSFQLKEFFNQYSQLI